MNRWYLLNSALFSFIIPLLDLKLFSFATDANIFSATSIEVHIEQTIQVTNNQSNNLSILLLTYITGCLLSFIWLLYRIFLVKKNLKVYYPGEAYSFLNLIRVDPELKGSDKIIAHEQIHIRQFHSLDILLMEIVKVFNWFNPIVYLLVRSLKLTHEYIADEKTTSSESDKIGYANLLVSQAFDTPVHSLKNNFFNKSFLKNRIAMLLKNKSKKIVLIRFSLLIPVVLIALAFQPISSTENQTQNREVIHESSTKLELDTGMLFLAVEEPPQPVGGMEKFYQYIGKNYIFPKEAVAEKVEGRVIVSFIVEQDGSLSNIESIRDLDYGTGEEAVRMLKDSPKWKPGIQNGKAVRVKFTLPIQLNQKKENEKPLDSKPSSDQNE